CKFSKIACEDSDVETESVCDPQLVRCRAENSERKLRDGILGQAGTPAAGRSLAARERQRRPGVPADRESKRGGPEGGVETPYRRERGGGIRQHRRSSVHEARRSGYKHSWRAGRNDGGFCVDADDGSRAAVG